jgi:hypothetical protein
MFIFQKNSIDREGVIQSFADIAMDSRARTFTFKLTIRVIIFISGPAWLTGFGSGRMDLLEMGASRKIFR